MNSLVVRASRRPLRLFAVPCEFRGLSSLDFGSPRASPPTHEYMAEWMMGKKKLFLAEKYTSAVSATE